MSLAFLIGRLCAGSPADSLLTATPEHCGLRDSTALRLCRTHVAANPSNAAARWREAYFASTLANREKDDDRREALLQEARTQARWMTANHPRTSDAWFVAALSDAVDAQHCGSRRRVELSRSIRANLDRGLAVDSTHPGLLYLSGRWNYALANLSGLEKTYVNLVLGGVPKGATNEAALKAFLRAVEKRPDDMLFRLDLARTLKAMGQKERARAECLKALAFPIRNDEDPATHAKLQKLLKDL